MSFLAIDIGNSNVTVALYSDNAWREQWRFSSKLPRTDDEWLVLLEAALNRNKLLPQVSACAIASVVPPLTDRIARVVTRLLGADPSVITSDCFSSLTVTYEPRNAIGVDRLCGVAAGLIKFGAPLIIVDLGTATVFDVVDETRIYQGGVIAPGLATAAESLHRNAALLPQITLEFPGKIVGASTVAAMQSGILYGALAMIDGIVTLIRSETNYSGKVVATGGFASMIQSRSKTIDVVEPDLVLDGIRLVGAGESW